MSELKPCPFCLGKAYIMATGQVAHHCQTGRGESFPETWNTRPIEDALIQQVATLTEQLRQANEDASVMNVMLGLIVNQYAQHLGSHTLSNIAQLQANHRARVAKEGG